jgi:hypothetical protein
MKIQTDSMFISINEMEEENISGGTSTSKKVYIKKDGKPGKDGKHGKHGKKGVTKSYVKVTKTADKVDVKKILKDLDLDDLIDIDIDKLLDW